MVDLDIAMAPGCYGISLLFKAASTECGTCPFAGRCEPLARQQLAMLRSELGITEQKQKLITTAPSPTPAGGTLSNRMPVKVQELVDAIERAGLKVTDALTRGINPFPPKFPFMRIACHLLLKRQGAGVSRDEFCQAFMTMLKVQRGTADAYVAQAVRALREIGAAVDANERIRIRA